MTAEDVDAETLHREIKLIQDAMGIGERNPSRLRDWLVFGVLVAVASAVSQYVHLQALPRYWHPAVWFVVMGGGSVLAYWGNDGGVETPETKPSIPLVYAGALLAYVPIVVAVSPLVEGIGYRHESVIVLGLVVILIGIAYLGVGNALRAYRIRRRDRYVMYVGGLWMLTLGGIMPHWSFLVDWGYAVFGGLYLGYALVSYAFLARS